MPEHANSIQITGNFDNWSRSIPAKESVKHYAQRVQVDTPQKLVFKFIVNGEEWSTNSVYKSEADESGIHNNVIEGEELIKVSEDVPEVEDEESVEEKEVAAPEVIAPEVTAPEVTAPEVTAPEVIAPKIIAPEIKSTSTPVPEVPSITSNIYEKSPARSTSSSVYSETAVDLKAADSSNIADLSEEVTSEIDSIEEPISEDEILSDIDDVLSGPEIISAPANDDLSHITTGSSYAGVSLTSEYDEVNKEDAHPDSAYDAADDEDDLYATPSTSILNSTVLGKDSPARPKLSSQDSESTIAKENPNEVVQILKAPGGYPASPTKADLPVSPPGRRETMISRFKGLFKY